MLLALLDFAAVYYRMRSHACWGEKASQNKTETQ